LVSPESEDEFIVITNTVTLTKEEERKKNSNLIENRFVELLKERMAELSQGWDLATNPPTYHSLGAITTKSQVCVCVCIYIYIYV
jgi:hypothetical protein